VFVTNDTGAAELAARVRSFGQDVRLDDGASFDVTRPLDGTRSLDSQTLGGMYRGNEMMAALVRSQLKRLPELTRLCQENAARLSSRLAELPGVTPPAELPGRTSVHHKVRVHLDPAKAGLSCSPRALRDVIATALRAEGCDVGLWQSEPLPAQEVFRRRAQSAFRSLPEGTDLAQNYQASRYPNATRLLDGSFILFSHSCPLIAQSAKTVDRYAEAFARVWRNRDTIVQASR
jgi:dTDP-4-amino-4,6-dideoxygalactose transaminase